QGSLSELFVPYQDPSAGFRHLNFFDLGSFVPLMGGVASTLEPGLDCPANAVFFEATSANPKGGSVIRRRAACLFERLGGEPSWRHAREQGGDVYVRARRDLVLRMFM